MKSLILISLMLFSTFTASASETSGNPDKMPSVGLILKMTDLSGHDSKLYLQCNQLYVKSDSAHEYTNEAGIDLILPIDHRNTFTGSVSYMEHYGDLNGSFAVRGQGASIGLRHYFK